MPTSAQEKWLAHLDDTNSTEIFPADPKAGGKFVRIKKLIRSVLGEDTIVEHMGSTSMGIGGQGELDIYLPVPSERFDAMVDTVEKLFGKPGSRYPLERARFVTNVDGTKAEVFVINSESKGWTDSRRFEDYLRRNPESLAAYARLKESARGLSTQKYYRRKTEFINEILGRLDKNN